MVAVEGSQAGIAVARSVETVLQLVADRGRIGAEDIGKGIGTRAPAYAHGPFVHRDAERFEEKAVQRHDPGGGSLGLAIDVVALELARQIRMSGVDRAAEYFLAKAVDARGGPGRRR